MGTFKRVAANIALAIGLGLLAAGGAAGQTIKVGLISADSGPWALFGGAGKNGAILAADEINAQGGVLGRKLELVMGDSKSRPEEASRLFREMVAGGAVVVLGVIGSGEVQAVSTLASEQKVPFIIAFGYGRFLTEEAGHRYFFRLISNSRAYYGPMVDRVIAAGHSRYCTISNDFAFGRDLIASVTAELKKKNPKAELLSGCEFWVPVNTTDFSTYLTAILAKKPQLLMFGGVVGNSLPSFMNQANQFGIFKQMAGAHPSLGWPANNAGIKEADVPRNSIITGSDYPYPPVNTPESKSFHSAYTKRWNEGPMSESAHAYASMYFIKSAFEKAGKVDREAFVGAAEGLSFVHPSMGKLMVRPFDHQSNAGVWVGHLGWSKEYKRPGMEDITYVPGDKYLPSEEEVKALRSKK
jgi:branched-chain amino acid transport system substrate-binding protein